jgi:hypothetical protein
VSHTAPVHLVRWTVNAICWPLHIFSSGKVVGDPVVGVYVLTITSNRSTIGIYRLEPKPRNHRVPLGMKTKRHSTEPLGYP